MPSSGLCVVDRATRQIRVGSELIQLTPKAFDLLCVLVDEAPRVVTKAEFHRRLWPDRFVSDANLFGLIKEVRRAFRHSSGQSLVKTFHGIGYSIACRCERHGDQWLVGSALEGVGSTVLAATEEDLQKSGQRTRSGYFKLDVAGRALRLRQGESMIGREPGSTIHIPSKLASRMHARITIDGDVAILEDLKSKNGTYVGELRVAAPHHLKDGDAIRVGDLTMRFHAVEATPTRTGAE